MTDPSPLKTKPSLVKTQTAREPRPVREDAGLSVQEMADLMGMGLDGYQSWENGLRRPGGPAVRLLQLIDNDPKGVIAVLK